MKSKKELSKEIKEVLSEIQEADKIPGKKGRSLVKKLKLKLNYLKTCLMYIESNPKEEFLKKEIKRLTARVNLLDEGFDEWRQFPRKDVVKGNLKTFYLKKVGVPHLKNQIKTLSFILK